VCYAMSGRSVSSYVLNGVLELSRASFIIFVFTAINIAIAIVDALSPIEVSVRYGKAGLEMLIKGSSTSLCLEIALSLVAAIGFVSTLSSYFYTALEILIQSADNEKRRKGFERLFRTALAMYLISVVSSCAGYIELSTHLEELYQGKPIALGTVSTVLCGVIPIVLGLGGDLFMALLLASLRRIVNEGLLVFAGLLLIFTSMYPEAYPLAWLVVFLAFRRALTRLSRSLSTYAKI